MATERRLAILAKALIIASGFLLLPALPVHAVDFTVPGNCDNLDDVFRSARRGRAEGSCTVGDNASREDNTLTITADITLTASPEAISSRNFTVEGNGYSIDGAEAHRIFGVTGNGELTINNLVLTGGSPAIEFRGAELNLNNVLIRDSERSAAGAAITARGSGSVVIRNSAFHDNEALAGSYGGAVYVGSVDLSVINSTFYNNRADRGSAIAADGRSDVKLINVTITRNNDNESSDNGAFYLTSGSLNMRNTIIYGNNRNCHLATGVTLNSANVANIVGGNSSANCAGDIAGDPRLAGSPSVPRTPGGSGGQSLGPWFELRAGSAAIDAGNAAACAEAGNRDQRGKSRPVGACDIGAIESTISTTGPSNGEAEESGAGQGGAGASAPGLPTSCESLPPNIVVSNRHPATRCQQVRGAGIGNAALVAGGSVDAVDVWNVVRTGTLVCFDAAGGSLIFLDAATSPRRASELSVYRGDAELCATIDRPGTVVLMPPPPPSEMPCGSLPASIVVSNRHPDTRCQQVSGAGIGNAELVAGGSIDAVDLWNHVQAGTQVCFAAAGGSIHFLDAATSPRARSQLEAFSADGMLCATIDRTGTVVLMPGAAPAT